MIEVISISAAKNSLGVNVNQDIEITVRGDFPLDPRDVSFKINGVPVIANIFSVYQGGVDYDLDITLFTRRRIKYDTGRKYGGDGSVYGTRDVFPSMLQYGSRYVLEYTVWGINGSDEREEITDSFVFTTEEGIFYNDNSLDYFYSDATQGLANYFPEWSKTRFDKFSNFQQLVNPLGEDLEKIQDFVTEQGANNYIQTTDLNQLAVMEKVELGKDFSITSTLNEDGSLFYVQPEITAIQDITRYDLFTEVDNTISEFYYNKLPTRLGTNRTLISDNVIHSTTKATEVKEFIEKEIETDGGFSIKAFGIDSSINRDLRGKVLIVKCRIYGSSLFGTDQTEEMILYNERDIITRKLWSEIKAIQFFNLFGQDVTYEIKYFREPKTIHIDNKQITTADDKRESILWDTETRNSNSVLRKHLTLGDTGADLLRNSGRTQVVQEFHLLDIDNATPLNLIDVVVDKNTNNVYGLSADYLYIFDKRESYPTRLKEIPGNNGLADFLIELDSDELGLEDNGEKEILLKCIHKTLGKSIIRYRLRLKKPDGTQIFIKDDGSFTNDIADASIYVKQDDLLLEEKQHVFVADQIGDHILELETMYKGGVSSNHKQLVRVLGSAAKAKYKLERIMNEEVPLSIFFDQDQRLKILTTNNIIQELVLHKDGVLIDYDDKILYFSEDYNTVDVE